MRNRLVPETEWSTFLDDFSRRHRGRFATVRVFNPRIGSQIEARDMPLEGVVSQIDAPGRISIHLGSAPPRSNIEHEIDAPRRVWLGLSEGGAEEALEVESDDGTKTLIELRASASPRDTPETKIGSTR